jgi:hypothetical protein
MRNSASKNPSGERKTRKIILFSSAQALRAGERKRAIRKLRAVGFNASAAAEGL